VDIFSDAAHCSGCDEVCGDEETCCAGLCVDTQIDGVNCGTCANACTDGRICVAGDCCQASVGGPCDPNGCCTAGLCDAGFCRYADPGEPCDEDSDCASFRCDEARGRCSLLSPFGGPCDGDLDCAVDGLACVSGACLVPPICRSGIGSCAALGESCAGPPCCSGTCAGGVCACIQAGQGCRDQYDCCFGSVCWEGVCRTTEGVGDPCASDADCDLGAFCRPVAQFCDRCESGAASMGPYLVDDCPWPMPGFACGPDPATGHPGFGYCCIPGENCAGDPCARPCNPDLTAQAGLAICPPLTLP
jgi:hypothetical protein